MTAPRKRHPKRRPYVGAPRMPTVVTQHSVTIFGHKTAVTMEVQFWDYLEEIATERGITRRALVEEIDTARMHANLSSACRLFCLKCAQDEIARRKLNDRAETDMGAEARV